MQLKKGTVYFHGSYTKDLNTASQFDETLAYIKVYVCNFNDKITSQQSSNFSLTSFST